MIQPLNEIIGLPLAASPGELASAADRCCETLFDLASVGDAQARRQLVELHVAYLVWAYTGRELRRNGVAGH